MVVFPHCKVNLGLRVISKRSDGYHNLETCFYPVPWTDVLEVLPADRMSLTISGNSIPGAPEENLCLKAYNILRVDHDLPPVKIHLHKIIPSGAGLGGGSSNGAYMLRVLDTIFKLGLDAGTLIQYAARLGSDCGFFTQDNPMIGLSRGEELVETSLRLKNSFIVIIKPAVSISTAEAFACIRPAEALPHVNEIVEQHNLASWKTQLKNDFEEGIFQKHPVIRTLRDSLYAKGATYAAMSGSGSAVFGLFDTEVETDEWQNNVIWSGWLS